MTRLTDYLQRAVTDRASDLFIVAGGPVCVKKDNRLVPLSEDRVFPAETEELIRQVYSVAKRPMEKVVKATLPFYACMIIALLLISFIPDISLAIPKLCGYDPAVPLLFLK